MKGLGNGRKKIFNADLCEQMETFFNFRRFDVTWLTFNEDFDALRRNFETFFNQRFCGKGNLFELLELK